jgi:hypothetical protein
MIERQNGGFHCRPMDEPPVLGPDEKPSPEEFGRLSLKLLRELAQHDPRIAQKLRDEGIPIED